MLTDCNLIGVAGLWRTVPSRMVVDRHEVHERPPRKRVAGELLELTAPRFKLFVGEPLLRRVRGAAGTVFFLAREIVNLAAKPV